MQDMSIVGRPAHSCFLVDNSPACYLLQPKQGLPIESWFDDQGDTELLKLLPFLESLAECEDVRPKIREQFELHKLVYGQ